MARIASIAAMLLLAACSSIGGSEITVVAVNEANEPMIVQVVDGIGPDAAAYGPSHLVAPGETRDVELAVPGGSWTVTVNGDRLLGSDDAGARRGRLPVTLILSDTGAHWQAPDDWVDIDP